MEDMDTYSMISQRIVTDDIFTIVDSYFMPYGIECDQYSVMGEILDYYEIQEHYDRRRNLSVYIENVMICSLMSVSIRQRSPGRAGRLAAASKESMWLQGQLHY